MTLDEALEMTRENKMQIRMAGEDITVVRSQYRGTNALFLPQITLEETAISTNNLLNVFGSKLRQEVVITADFDPALLNDPGIMKTITILKVQQPLINPIWILWPECIEEPAAGHPPSKGANEEVYRLPGKADLLAAQV